MIIYQTGHSRRKQESKYMAKENKTEHKKITDAKALKAVEKGVGKVTKIKFITEFKDFISKGNVMDMAVGMIVGAAFTAIVTSLVNNILMPALGMITGQIDFSDLKIILQAAVKDEAGEIITPEVAIGYGAFINSVISFLLIALSVFILIKVLGSFKRKKKEEPKEEEEPKPDPQIELLTEIRDLLKNGGAVSEETESEEATEEEKEEEPVTE